MRALTCRVSDPSLSVSNALKRRKMRGFPVHCAACQSVKHHNNALDLLPIVDATGCSAPQGNIHGGCQIPANSDISARLEIGACPSSFL
eukprot:1195865-Prorocentrum_minimum.AAC.6